MTIQGWIRQLDQDKLTARVKTKDNNAEVKIDPSLLSSMIRAFIDEDFVKLEVSDGYVVTSIKTIIV
jgi:hypothetical protein